MTNTRRSTGQAIGALSIVLALAAALQPAIAGPVTFQEGLPPALTIAIKPQPDGSTDQNDLREQLGALERLAAWAKEHQPKLGWTERFFGSGKSATPVTLRDLAAFPDRLKGQAVSLHGVYQPSKDAVAEIRSDQERCLINLAEGTQPEGFIDKNLNGLPVVVEGTVESRGNVPVIRASALKPSYPLCVLRMARIHELLGEYEKAQAVYLTAEGANKGGGGDYAAFARVSAGRIAYDNLRDERMAEKYWNMGWTLYLTNVPAGTPAHRVWMPQMKEQLWQSMGVREAIAEKLDLLNGKSFWYRFVAFFVAVCGGNAALGVLLIAVVVRMAIWPLTKKQLQSAEAMKKLQPQIKELQARLADDKQKFQQEFWKLCQANGVNPLGGCLPLIVQMPVLIMVYKGIRLYIVEFDKASFLWVPNLAGPDMILLVAYTISMILFQKMTQKTNPQAAMDPQQEQQQKMMMYMMPLMFFFMFKTFPASFILYWLGTNIIYFLQQWNYNRLVAVRDGNALAVAEKKGGVVGSMVKLLSGEPAEDGGAAGDRPEPGENASKDNVDRRSLEELRRDEKRATKPKKGPKRR